MGNCGGGNDHVKPSIHGRKTQKAVGATARDSTSTVALKRHVLGDFEGHSQ